MSIIQRSRGLISEELSEEFVGSDGSGSDGETNRIFTITIISTINISKVYYEGTLVKENVHYTKDNLNKQVTFLIPVWDANRIKIFYNVI